LCSVCGPASFESHHFAFPCLLLCSLSSISYLQTWE
jgi:hypothetical protein